MADGVQISAGSGTTVLTDDTGATGHAQVVKLAISTDGSPTLIPADATNGIDVDVTRVSGTVTVANGGTFVVQATCTQSGTWNIGTVTTVGTITNVVHVDDNSGSLTVDGTVTADTELPAAAALADGAANPTTPTVGAATLVWNGTTWDRLKGDTTNGAYVNVKAMIALPAGTANIGDVDVLTVPADPFGANADAASATGSISAKLRFIAATGIPITGTVTVGTHAVTQSGAWTVVCGGDVAHDAVDSGNPIKQGGIAQLTAITAVADADRVNFVGDSQGRQVVAPHGVRDLIKTQTTTIAASTAETTVVTAVASHFMDLLQVVIANTSATAARVDFRDTTAGSVIFSLYAPAGATVGFTAAAPLSQTSVNTNWTAQSSASITDLRILMVTRKTK